MTPNEHDKPTTTQHPEEFAHGADAGMVAGASENGQYEDYVTSGTNPFSSAYPQGTGMFQRPTPREFPRDEFSQDDFPQDEMPPDLPVMEPLPDPNALPDPGYPVMTGYRAFPSAVSAFPPSAQAGPEPDFRYPDSGSSYAEPEPPYAESGSSYADPGSPYQAPRAPEEAPPLHGPAVPVSDVQAPIRPEDAPPLTAPHGPFEPAASGFTAASRFPAAASYAAAQYRDAPPSRAVAGYPLPREPLSAPPALQEPATAEPPARETADSLTADMLLHGKRAAPGVGWRRTVYRATGGLVRIGESAANLRRRDLVSRVRTPVAGGHHRVAVMSLKGGVGKTTAAVGLGSTLASLRGDRVIAVDANPDRGTLSDKVRLETPATIRDLLNERAQVSRYADVRAYTSQSSSRLEILASDRDPGVSVAFSADDYRAVARVLEHYYSICITDCGTGLLHSAMAGILELADQIVLVSSPSVDGARSASATLDWLEAHDYGDLVRNGVVVLSMIRPKTKSAVDLDRLEQHFAARSRAVVRIPYDPHLEEGAEVELELLNSDTADAYLALAATVGDGFAVPRRPISRITRTAPLA
jgi:MinD-like ATPase involved in chromosome partitioning or flagellar assembly